MIRAKHIITGYSTRCTETSKVSAVDTSSSNIRLETFCRIAYIERTIDLHFSFSIAKGHRGMEQDPNQSQKNDRSRAQHEHQVKEIDSLYLLFISILPRSAQCFPAAFHLFCKASFQSGFQSFIHPYTVNAILTHNFRHHFWRKNVR